jgi:uncharacterized protein (TIGR02996 family)
MRERIEYAQDLRTANEDALLRTIAANPYDDTPLWIYADWLDENGFDGTYVRGIERGDMRYPLCMQFKARLNAIRSVANLLAANPNIV